MISRLRKRLTSDSGGILARDIFISFGIQIAGFGLLYVLNVLLARWLGSQRYGDYVFTYNWIVLIAIVGNFGFLRSTFKFVPEYFEAQRWRELWGFLLVSFAAMIFGSIALVLLISVVLYTFPPNDITLNTVLLGLWLAPLFGLTRLLMLTLRGLKYVTLALLPTDVLRPLSHIILGFVLLELTPDDQAGVIVLVALFLSLLLVVVLHSGVLLFTLRAQFGSLFQSVFRLREWGQLSWDMTIIQVTGEVRARAPVIILGFIIGAEAAAIFAASERIAYLTILIYLAAQRIISPMVAPLYVNRDMAQLQWYFLTVTRWSVWASLLVGLGLIILSPFLLGLFGDEFIRAQPALIILVIAQVVNAGTGHNAVLLSYTEYAPDTRRVGLWMMPIIIGSNLLLVPVLGVEGTAIATAATQIIENYWLYLLVRRRLNLSLTLATFLPWRSLPGQPSA